MVLYTRDQKDPFPTANFLELINTSSKVSGYKAAAVKSVVFLVSNEKRQEGIRKAILFTVAHHVCEHAHMRVCAYMCVHTKLK